MRKNKNSSPILMSFRKIRESVRYKEDYSEEVKFIIVILTRVLETMDGFTLVGNKISSTETIMIRLYLNTPVPIFLTCFF